MVSQHIAFPLQGQVLARFPTLPGGGVTTPQNTSTKPSGLGHPAVELPMIPVEFLGWRAPWYLRAERGP